MPSFAEVQTAFAAAVIDPDAPAPLDVLADPDHQRGERFRVYRNNVISGLTDQMAGSFPVVRRLVGDEFFRAMARAFVLANPPRSPLLTDYGDGFAAFVECFPPAATLPYLADVAMLEALRVRAYHAADAAPLTPEAAARLAMEEPGALKVHPSASLLRSRFPVLTIWTANQPEAAPGRIRAVDGESVLIVRPGMIVNMHRIGALAAETFHALAGREAGLNAAAGDAAAIGELAASGALAGPLEEKRR